MTKDAYRLIAPIYDAIVEPANRVLRRAGVRAYPPRDDVTILDVGCGTGTQLARYRRPGCRLYGIDLSPAMVERARRKLGATAGIRCGDATNLDFLDGMFDLVTLALVLHELRPERRSAVLAECRRVVKPSGHILVLDYHTGPYPCPRGVLWKAAITLLERMAGRAHYANYREFLAHHAMERLIAEASLAVVTRVVPKSGTVAVYVLARQPSKVSDRDQPEPPARPM